MARAHIDYVWFIQGSENHDMMDLGNAYLAVQALAARPDYAGRRLPDGHTVEEHRDAWSAYFTRYCAERVRRGLFIEVASPTYGKYLIPELVNFYDFSENPRLRGNAEALLHLTWADWAIEQLDGVRGGAKARCYQGKYAQKGGSDSWRMMGALLTGAEGWDEVGRYAHPIMGFGFVLATTQYRLPEAVAGLAADADGRGEYAYVSRRPRTHDGPPNPCRLWAGIPVGIAWTPGESALVRYSWCTPDHVMGCFFVDPTLSERLTVDAGKPDEMRMYYAAISGQNRWQGIVFATGPDARIFPQCLGRPDKNKHGASVTEVQQVAVQYKQVMIVQTNRNRPENSAIRVYFAPGMRERLIEKDGWRFLEEGDSFAAVKAFARAEGAEACGVTWDDNHFLRLEDVYAPIVFVTGRRANHSNLEAFQAYVLGHRAEMAERRAALCLRRCGIDLLLGRKAPPGSERRGDRSLAAARAYNSPFVQSDFGSGDVRITFRGETLHLRVE